ncbi:laccase, multicopper oxidase, benzenediol:oxygen oxidorectuctase [Lithohypha guttulata]|nr:laccase, multicopper oxidase, benzenediol:oxygen oxidorectuctase [Lithohypha guttulata]
MAVVSMDFVPIAPIVQRWNVVIEANQPVDSYWLHVVSQAGCSANSVTIAVSVFSYEGANNTMPSDRTHNNAPPTSDCVDPNIELILWVPLNVPSNETIPRSSRLDVGFAVVQDSFSQTQTLVQWTLDSTAIVAEWHHSTLQYIREGTTAYPRSMSLINLPTKNQWSFWVIQAQVNSTTPPPQAHSTHLHGHDF